MFGYEVWNGGSCLHSDTGFEDEDEAREEANASIETIIQDWKLEEAWEGETAEDFEIKVFEC